MRKSLAADSIIWLLIFLVSGSYYGYIGFEYTWYRFGLYIFVPLIVGFSALIALVINARRREQWYWWKWFTGLSSATFTVLIIAHHIESYKPTVNLFIPNDFEGTVTMLPGREIQSSYSVDDSGIVYWRADEEVHLKIYHGSKNISGVLNETGYHQLVYYHSDSSIQEQISIQCFEVIKNREYPDNIWNQYHPKCMGKRELQRLIDAGIIDESKICKTRFKNKNSTFYPVKGQCF